MKKKILYLFLTMIVVMCPSYIFAKASDTCSAVLQMNKIYDNGTRYFAMTLNSAQAFCTDPGLQASSGNICTYDSSQTATTEQLKIVNYASQSNIVTQYLNYDEQQEVYISLSRGESLSNILKGRSDAVELEIKIVQEFNNTQPAVLNKDAIIMTCGAKQQRMIVLNSDLNCIEEKKVTVCPGGTMNISGGIGTCTTRKGGNIYAFSNTASPGSQSNIHRQYGIEKKKVSAYCSLYCQEYGEAILPGATGEPFNLGSYIIWPTSNSNSDNVKFKTEYYPLKFKGRLECKLAVQPDKNMPGLNGECENDPIEDYKNAYKILYEKKSDTTTLYKVEGDSGKTETITLKELIDKKIEKDDNKAINVSSCMYCTEEGCTDDPCATDSDVCSGLYSFDYCSKEYAGGEDCETYCGSKKGICYDTCSSNMAKCNEAIKKEINTCRSYVSNYNIAREILNEMSLCGSFQLSNDDSNDFYDFNSNVSMFYSDEEYSTGTVVKESSSKTITKNSDIIKIPNRKENKTLNTVLEISSNNLTSKVNGIRQREFEITAEDVYTLSTGYSFIDKKTLDYKTSSSGLKNYIDIGKQVIPTSYKNEIGKEYYLTLSGITFGSSLSNFGNGSSYVCVQKFTKNSYDCICPNDSDMAGKDLSEYIANNNETCADAQLKYCSVNSSNSSNPSDSPEASSSDYYCDAPMDYISIGPCVNAGGTVDHCKATYCPIMSEIECPNTYGVVDDSMNVRLRSCVQTKMEQGLTKNQAIDICEPLVCPIGGRRIIYRTIKLENPFPSMDADRTVTQKGLKSGMFNNNVKGRYPGTNWNGTLTVNKKIRNNRGVSGTTIYQKKEPLYTFVLNGTTINKIRDYNDKQKDGYNDFTLECKKDKHAACVSYVFVHNEGLSGLTGGTCQKISIDNGFYTCAD